MVRAEYVCINCGNTIAELFKKYSNSVKTSVCEKCHKVADKYIEFEPVIIFVDAMLLSEQAFRTMLYNRDFKLHWKLSLVLLLLESFALYRKRSADKVEFAQYELVNEKGFYLCCLQNIIDYATITLLLLLATAIYRIKLISSTGVRKFFLTLLKAIALANFSKFFLLPIMVWRENTTDVGASIHHLLVLGHHLISLIFTYAVVSNFNKLQATLIVLPAYFVKELWKDSISSYVETIF